ncbi:HAMP domain-containing sensor histidine kinase [uncultured Thiothrix sp.]|uniref:HAMP domain-containing sensor histidine kinase n=1 Tax=uncultured Thiothrix sp. TaxID=223185 RepID=UPI00262B3D99|nr:HAMP domain-containing sensor histidine kinase [uncultured Thiothrix sp.]HMT92164.1 HAMP domain-containing sensor histidine kinase [Thiolinea sp.]
MMLTLLLLPLATLYFFRIYENELVRQTELELIAQGATLAASYRQIMRLANPKSVDYGYVLGYSPLIPGQRRSYMRDETLDPYYTPITPELDLVKPVYAPRPDAIPTPQVADKFAQQAGALLTPVILNTQQVMLAGVRILDMKGLVVAGKEEMGMSLAHVPEVKQALKGYYSSVIRQRISDEPPPPLYSLSRGTHIRVFAAFPIIEGNRLQGVVYISRTPKNILKHLYLVQDKLYLAAGILLSLAVLLVLFLSSTLSRPIRDLIRQTQQVAEGELPYVQPLKSPVTYELAQLSESFASMSQALAERSDYIRRFASHVSHEFKTPLTSMQGALELLNEHIDSMPPERRQRFLDNLLSDTQRLKNLVNRLLELARADALEPSKQTSQLPELVRAMQNRYHERGLEIEADALPYVPLAIAPDTLETVLGNLFDNSLHHGASAVRLRAQPSPRQDSLVLSVHDNGEGISPANRERIFTPFFTTRRNAGGTGLGLEIVTSLLKAYNARIQLGSAQTGAEFILELALAS